MEEVKIEPEYQNEEELKDSSQRDTAKIVAVKTSGAIGMVIESILLYFGFVVFADLINIPVIETIGNIVLCVFCILISRLLLFYKKENIKANSIFIPIVLVCGISSLVFTVFASDSTIIIFPVIGYFYIIQYILQNLEANNDIKLLSLSICSLVVCFYSGAITDDGMIECITTIIFAFLILNSTMFVSAKKHTKFWVYIILLLIVLFTACENELVVVIILFALYVFQEQKNRLIKLEEKIDYLTKQLEKNNQEREED